ncbi:hypothetical protein DE146DRAFT_670756 [Phaeosphaeria sp. MPI-PUGE-AT-0046c]|nr:hypothetical protein DE146DRAFT_670756 [Phaeosphaeria sp. MPI-PUGE-AT-0046c]
MSRPSFALFSARSILRAIRHTQPANIFIPSPLRSAQNRVTMVTTAHVNVDTRKADGPFPLVETPAYNQNDSNPSPDHFVKVASHMALAHNVIIRGLNSIYKQAEFVRVEDYPGFVAYAYCWYEFLQAHHDLEEESLFPALERLTGEKGLMDSNVAEHRLFHTALAAYAEYLGPLRDTPHDFSASIVIKLIDALAPPLLSHLSSEIPTLLGLSCHPHFAKPSSEADLASAADSLVSLYAAEEKSITMRLSFTEGQMFFFFNLDREYEGGRWKDWPPVPNSVIWLTLRTWGQWRRSWWTFAACGMDGRLRVLEALKDKP